MRVSGGVIGMLAVLGIAAPARTQEPTPRWDLHVFGGWAYGKTSRNTYLSGTPQGNYQQGALALNLSAHPDPRLSFLAQAFWEQGNEGTETEIDYAFAEWKFSDAVKLRVGKVQQPFGIYTEVFDVGTVRPFLSLPQSVYGPVGIVSEGYQGVGLRGTYPLGKWGVSYDLYAGGIKIEEYGTPIQLLGEENEPVEDPSGIGYEITRNLVGARVVISLPVPGLTAGGSAITGTQSDEGAEPYRHTVLGAQTEFISNHLWLRSEIARHREQGKYTVHAFYAEAAYFMTRAWQLAARYDRSRTSFDNPVPPTALSLARHRDIAAGLNLWITPEFVLKGSYHVVEGNRLAGPPAAELAATIAAGQLNSRTRLVQLGVQFSF